MSERPKDLVYARDETPPPLPLVAIGFQHVAVICPYLVMVALVVGAGKLSHQDATSAMGLAMLAVALLTILQSRRLGPVGSGYLCPPVVSAIYLPSAMSAATTFGFPVRATLVRASFASCARAQPGLLFDRRHAMPSYVFPPAPIPAAPIRGRDSLFPIHRIFCVGRNYEAHAKEMGAVVDREAPFYFTKSAHAYVASGSTVPYPPGTSDYHHEMELVVAIGKAGLRIAAASALDHVYGYACGLDMTRRDLQTLAKEQRRPWDLGKDFEQAAVLSEIVPAADVAPPTAGRIELRVNGAARQASDLALLIHPVPAVIAHLSRYYRLQPGDLIYTGTPEGVGPVVAGDVLEGSIEGIGTISLNVGLA